MIRKHENRANYDNAGRLTCSSEDLHLLVQQKMLGKIGTGQGMRGAFKVFGPSPEGIGLARFKQMLSTIGLTTSHNDAIMLFSRYDDDGSGHIDMYELMRNLLPGDYKGKTWQHESYERQGNQQRGKNIERKMKGAKYHTATQYPKGLRSAMEPSIKDVEQMIRFKIESNAKDGRERDYALKMFGRPVNGISQPNLQRALERNNIPCSDQVLDSIFDSLQVCGLVSFDRLWHRVMPIDGRVRIGKKPRTEVQDALHRSKRRRRKRNSKSRQQSQRQSSRNGISPKSSSMGMLPSMMTSSIKSRKYTMQDIKRILYERISSHHNMETFSLNSFERKQHISFKVFCAGLRRLGVPATKEQASALFSKYDRNSGIVNHRSFFRDITQPYQGMGRLQQRTNAALYKQQRGWTPDDQMRRRLPSINIRVIKTPNASSSTLPSALKKHHKQHSNNKSLQHKEPTHRSTPMLSPMLAGPETNKHHRSSLLQLQSNKKKKKKKKKKPFYNIIYKPTSIW